MNDTDETIPELKINREQQSTKKKKKEKGIKQEKRSSNLQ